MKISKLSMALLLLVLVGSIGLPSRTASASPIPGASAVAHLRTGIVKFFDEEKGHGFITDDGTQADIFVHKSGCVDTIRKGDQVTYEVVPGRKGLEAVSVRLA